jgi:hypothetical protein
MNTRGRGPAPPGAPALARRLRELRDQRWRDATVTQAMLAEAFGEGKSLGLSTISSWENPDSPTAPNERRLEAYATFFATRRSIEGPRPRVLALDELDEAERGERARLLDELLNLRDATPALAAHDDDAPATGIWRFRDGGPVRLVCGRPPANVQAVVWQHPYAAATNPNYQGCDRSQMLRRIFGSP